MNKNIMKIDVTIFMVRNIQNKKRKHQNTLKFEMVRQTQLQYSRAMQIKIFYQ